MNLKTRIIVAFSFIILGLVCVLVVILGIYLRNFQKNQTLKFLYSQVELADASYDNFLKSLEIMTTDWSTDGYVLQMTQDILRVKGEKKEAISNQLGNWLTTKKMISPSVVIVDVLNGNGVVVASTRKERIDKNEKDAKIRFNDVINSDFGEAFVETAVFEEDEDSENPMIHVSARMFSLISSSDNPMPLDAVILLHFNNTDQLKTVISGGEPEIKDIEKLSLFEAYKSADIYLVNSDSVMMVPSRWNPRTVLKQRVDTSPVRKCLEEGKDFSGEYIDYLGRNVIGVSECLDHGKAVLVFEVEKKEALSFMAGVYIYLATAGFAIGFLGIMLAFLIANRFTKDLIEFIKMVKKVADNKEYSSRFETDKVTSEIGMLSRSFNYLLDSLNLFQKNLSKSETMLKESNFNLDIKVKELQKTNSLMVDRELKMIELKNNIRRFKKKEIR